LKSFSKLVVLGAVLTASSPFALGAPITVGSSFLLSGSDTFTSSSVTFGTAQVGNPGDTGTTNIKGTFATYLTDGPSGSAVTFLSPLYYSNGTYTLPSTELISIAGAGGEQFTFNITGYTASYTDFGGGNASLTINGTGTFQSGPGSPVTYASTPGSFMFYSEEVNGNTQSNFSASAVAVSPEPNSVVLLGTGLISVAGLVFVRRRQALGVL
jgi:hypothetical protein